MLPLASALLDRGQRICEPLAAFGWNRLEANKKALPEEGWASAGNASDGHSAQSLGLGNHVVDGEAELLHQ